jgi:hypothetical protein
MDLFTGFYTSSALRAPSPQGEGWLADALNAPKGKAGLPGSLQK